MEPSTLIANDQKTELLEAQAHVWSHILNFHNTMALKCAMELGIPDAIQKHGKPITLIELTKLITIHPDKGQFLCRLMRQLVHSKFFSIKKSPNGEDIFDLTLNSQLLLTNHPFAISPIAICSLDSTLVEPSKHLSKWFRNNDQTPFHTAHGKGIWDYAGSDPLFNDHFNQAMANDAKFVASFLVSSDEFKGVFTGIESMVDVGGGTGTMAKAIAEAFPTLKCSVLELPHVVESLQEDGRNVLFVKGDMFEAIPPADAILLKWILHDWNDDQCIKILQRCKEAIPKKDKGGKLIILDIVVGAQYGHAIYNSVQLLWDMQMLSVAMGKERSEEEWKYLFISAGFSDYKIFPILGTRCIIEVYQA